MKKIEKSEIKYFFGALTIILILLFLTNNKKSYEYISSLNPVLQFLLINLGLYFSLFFVLKSFALRVKLSRLIKGSLGSLLMFLSLDLILPEYHVIASKGLVVGGVFGASATDYFFGYLYSLLGIHGLGLVVFTYPITFIILFGLGAYLTYGAIKNL